MGLSFSSLLCGLRLSRCSLGLAFFLALGGCSVLPHASNPLLEEEDSDIRYTPIQTQEPKHYRSIPTETLYTLLVAEIAGHRQQYQLAFELYLQQAETSQDPVIAERATRIAQYLGYPPFLQQSLELWLSIEPNNPAVHQVAAQLNIEQGDFLQALKHTEILQTLAGVSQYDYLAANSDRASAEEKALLLNSLERLRAEQPRNASLWVATSLVKQSLEHYPDALNDIEKALALDQALPASLQKARILVLMERQEEALNWLKKLQKKHPKNKSLEVLYGRILLEQRKIFDARRVFADLHQQFPEDANILLSLALLYDETQEPEKARQGLFQLLANGERVNEAHFFLGRLAEKQGDPEQALEQYRQISSSPEFMIAQVRVIEILSEQHSLAEARDFLQEQQNNFPEYRERLLALEIEFLINTEQPDLALEVLNATLKAPPNQEQADLLYTRGMLYEQQGEHRLFEQDMRALLALDENNVNALNALGYVWTTQNIHLEQAQMYLEKAYRLDPENPAIADSLGWLYFKQQNYGRALTLLGYSYSRLPEAEVAAHLGEVLWAIGQKEQAMTIFKQGFKAKQDHPILLETLERLHIDLNHLNTMTAH